MRFLIEGIGTALPPHHIAQEDAIEIARAVSCRTDAQARALSKIYHRARVRQRASVLLGGANDVDGAREFLMPSSPERDQGPSTADRMERYRTAAPPLAAEASRNALANADVDPAGISHLITVSCTGFGAPGLDIELIDRLNLSPDVTRTHVGFMGCHGVLNGLRVANAFASAAPGKTVLLCAAELCSLHLQTEWNAHNVVSGSLFADGAAALVGRATVPNGRAGWRVRSMGSFLIPNSRDAMTWHIGDNGFRMTLAPDVPKLLAQHLKPWLDHWLAESGLSPNEVGGWAIHPGGPRILDAVEQLLDLAPAALDTSRETLAECGNMSSPTVLFILDRMAKHRPVPHPCVALAFGPGLVIEAALLE
jgi:predicted naringenin-chalcone synthase